MSYTPVPETFIQQLMLQVLLLLLDHLLQQQMAKLGHLQLTEQMMVQIQL